MNSSDLSCIPMLTIGYNVEKSDFRNPDPRINLPNSFLHTNFKIKSEGEDVVLSNASGKILDSYNSVYIQTDRSKGRIKEGDTWSFFEISTRPNPLIPGVSITLIFESRSNISAWVVVC